MKWQIAAISLMIMTLLLIGVATVQALLFPSLQHSELFNGQLPGSHLQMGYYDLLSKKSELYDPRFKVSDSGVTLQLCNPDDNRVQIKVTMTLKSATAQGLVYDYKPVYVSRKKNDLLISSLLGYVQHESILLNIISHPQGKITAFSSGQIISTS